MGGVLIVLSTAVPTLLWADLGNAFVGWRFFRCWVSRRSDLSTITRKFPSNAIWGSPARKNSRCRFWSV